MGGGKGLNGEDGGLQKQVEDLAHLILVDGLPHVLLEGEGAQHTGHQQQAAEDTRELGMHCAGSVNLPASREQVSKFFEFRILKVQQIWSSHDHFIHNLAQKSGKCCCFIHKCLAAKYLTLPHFFKGTGTVCAEESKITKYKRSIMKAIFETGHQSERLRKRKIISGKKLTKRSGS